MTSQRDGDMGSEEELTTGEIKRSLKRIEDALGILQTEVRSRHHELANQMNVALAPIAELKVRMERCEADINGLGKKFDELDTKIDSVQSRADRMSGAVGLAAVICTLIPWPWKH